MKKLTKKIATIMLTLGITVTSISTLYGAIQKLPTKMLSQANAYNVSLKVFDNGLVACQYKDSYIEYWLKTADNNVNYDILKIFGHFKLADTFRNANDFYNYLLTIREEVDVDSMINRISFSNNKAYYTMQDGYTVLLDQTLLDFLADKVINEYIEEYFIYWTSAE